MQKLRICRSRIARKKRERESFWEKELLSICIQYTKYWPNYIYMYLYNRVKPQAQRKLPTQTDLRIVLNSWHLVDSARTESTSVTESTNTQLNRLSLSHPKTILSICLWHSRLSLDWVDSKSMLAWNAKILHFSLVLHWRHSRPTSRLDWLTLNLVDSVSG